MIPVLAWFIKEIPLRTANEAPPQATPEEDAEVALGKAAPVALTPPHTPRSCTLCAT